MIVQPQNIQVKLTPNTKKYYYSLGYTRFNNGDIFTVDVTELPINSRINVEAECDNCKNKFTKRLFDFQGKNKFKQKTFCSKNCYSSYISENNSEINPNANIEKIKVNCDQCGKEKLVFPSVAKKNKYHFCSRECYSKYRSENFNGSYMYNYNSVTSHCDNCNKEMIIPKFDYEKNRHNFCSNECYYEFRSKFYVGEEHSMYGKKLDDQERERIRLMTIKRHQNGEFPQTQTSIHKKINEYLNQKGIKFINEFPTKYYSIDIYLPEDNLMIEIMGDYWHCNPLKYKKLEDVNENQRKSIIRDKSKNSYIKKYYGINILYLWEIDINKNLILCRELIDNYIYNRGVLENYQSFNFDLNNDGEIILKNKITKPYFLKNGKIKINL